MDRRGSAGGGGSERAVESAVLREMRSEEEASARGRHASNAHAGNAGGGGRGGAGGTSGGGGAPSGMHSQAKGQDARRLSGGGSCSVLEEMKEESHSNEASRGGGGGGGGGGASGPSGGGRWGRRVEPSSPSHAGTSRAGAGASAGNTAGAGAAGASRCDGLGGTARSGANPGSATHLNLPVAGSGGGGGGSASNEVPGSTLANAATDPRHALLQAMAATMAPAQSCMPGCSTAAPNGAAPSSATDPNYPSNYVPMSAPSAATSSNAANGVSTIATTNPSLQELLGGVEEDARKAKSDGGMAGVLLYLGCAIKLMKAARGLERNVAAFNPSAEELWSHAARFWAHDILKFATGQEPGGGQIAASCAKFAAACSMRAYRMRAGKALLELTGSSAAQKKNRSVTALSEPVRRLQSELRARATEGLGQLRLNSGEGARLEHALQLLLDFSTAVEGYDFGETLRRASKDDVDTPEWFRDQLPRLADFATVGAQELLDLGARLQGLVSRLIETRQEAGSE